mgnify:FL=1
MAYTDIDDPSAHFQTTLYTGNGGNGHVITHTGNSDLQADMVWIKMRSAAYNQVVYDTSRRPSGTPFSGSLYVLALGNNYGTGAENTGAYGPTAIGSDSVTMNSYDTINKSSETFVSWNWKANGGTTTSVSASGTGEDSINASTHQVNTTAGFSIITYTGRDDQISNGQETKLTHGLGVKPDMFICKRRDGTSNWYVLGANATETANFGWSYNEYLALNNTSAVVGVYYTGNKAADSNYIYLGNQLVNTADSWIGYAFTSKQGYSKFGRYTGNGNASGPFVYTGFQPAFVMLKIIDTHGGTSDSWAIFDNKRSDSGGFNVIDKHLRPDNDAAESDPGGDPAVQIDLLSNGFKIRTANGQLNAVGDLYSYTAFAEHPFVTSTGVPTTAR